MSDNSTLRQRLDDLQKRRERLTAKIHQRINRLGIDDPELLHQVAGSDGGSPESFPGPPGAVSTDPVGAAAYRQYVRSSLEHISEHEEIQNPYGMHQQYYEEAPQYYEDYMEGMHAMPKISVDNGTREEEEYEEEEVDDEDEEGVDHHQQTHANDQSFHEEEEEDVEHTGHQGGRTHANEHSLDVQEEEEDDDEHNIPRGKKHAKDSGADSDSGDHSDLSLGGGHNGEHSDLSPQAQRSDSLSFDQDENGRFIDGMGRFVDGEGRLVDQYGRYVDQDFRLIDIDGRFVDEDGRYIDEDGRFVDIEGRLIDENGRFIDESGRLIDAEGYFVNENGDYVDESGAKIEEDNSPIYSPNEGSGHHDGIVDEEEEDHPPVEQQPKAQHQNKPTSQQQSSLSHPNSQQKQNPRVTDSKGHRLIDKDGYYVNSNGDYVDEEGNVLDDEEEHPHEPERDEHPILECGLVESEDEGAPKRGSAALNMPASEHEDEDRHSLDDHSSEGAAEDVSEQMEHKNLKERLHKEHAENLPGDAASERVGASVTEDMSHHDGANHQVHDHPADHQEADDSSEVADQHDESRNQHAEVQGQHPHAGHSPKTKPHPMKAKAKSRKSSKSPARGGKAANAFDDSKKYDNSYDQSMVTAATGIGAFGVAGAKATDGPAGKKASHSSKQALSPREFSRPKQAYNPKETHSPINSTRPNSAPKKAPSTLPVGSGQTQEGGSSGSRAKKPPVSKKEYLLKKKKIAELEKQLEKVRNVRASKIQRWWRMKIIMPRFTHRRQVLLKAIKKVQNWWRIMRANGPRTKAHRMWYWLTSRHAMELIRHGSVLSFHDERSPGYIYKPMNENDVLSQDRLEDVNQPAHGRVAAHGNVVHSPATTGSTGQGHQDVHGPTVGKIHKGKGKKEFGMPSTDKTAKRDDGIKSYNQMRVAVSSYVENLTDMDLVDTRGSAAMNSRGEGGTRADMCGAPSGNDESYEDLTSKREDGYGAHTQTTGWKHGVYQPGQYAEYERWKDKGYYSYVGEGKGYDKSYGGGKDAWKVWSRGKDSWKGAENDWKWETNWNWDGWKDDVGKGKSAWNEQKWWSGAKGNDRESKGGDWKGSWKGESKGESWKGNKKGESWKGNEKAEWGKDGFWKGEWGKGDAWKGEWGPKGDTSWSRGDTSWSKSDSKGSESWSKGDSKGGEFRKGKGGDLVRNMPTFHDMYIYSDSQHYQGYPIVLPPPAAGPQSPMHSPVMAGTSANRLSRTPSPIHGGMIPVANERQLWGVPPPAYNRDNSPRYGFAVSGGNGLEVNQKGGFDSGQKGFDGGARGGMESHLVPRSLAGLSQMDRQGILGLPTSEDRHTAQSYLDAGKDGGSTVGGDLTPARSLHSPRSQVGEGGARTLLFQPQSRTGGTMTRSRILRKKAAKPLEDLPIQSSGSYQLPDNASINARPPVSVHESWKKKTGKDDPTGSKTTSSKVSRDVMNDSILEIDEDVERRDSGRKGSTDNEDQLKRKSDTEEQGDNIVESTSSAFRVTKRELGVRAGNADKTGGIASSNSSKERNRADTSVVIFDNEEKGWAGAGCGDTTDWDDPKNWNPNDWSSKSAGKKGAIEFYSGQSMGQKGSRKGSPASQTDEQIYSHYLQMEAGQHFAYAYPPPNRPPILLGMPSPEYEFQRVASLSTLHDAATMRSASIGESVANIGQPPYDPTAMDASQFQHDDRQIQPTNDWDPSLLHPRGMQLLGAAIRGAIVRRALAHLWPQVQQTHDVYAMVTEIEKDNPDEEFLDNLYGTLRRQYQELAHNLRRARFRSFKPVPVSRRVAGFRGWKRDPLRWGAQQEVHTPNTPRVVQISRENVETQYGENGMEISNKGLDEMVSITVRKDYAHGVNLTPQSSPRKIPADASPKQRYGSDTAVTRNINADFAGVPGDRESGHQNFNDSNQDRRDGSRPDGGMFASENTSDQDEIPRKPVSKKPFLKRKTESVKAQPVSWKGESRVCCWKEEGTGTAAGTAGVTRASNNLSSSVAGKPKTSAPPGKLSGGVAGTDRTSDRPMAKTRALRGFGGGSTSGNAAATDRPNDKPTAKTRALRAFGGGAAPTSGARVSGGVPPRGGSTTTGSSTMGVGASRDNTSLMIPHPSRAKWGLRMQSR